MKDLANVELPWFVSLLGHSTSHAQFAHMCAEYALTNDELDSQVGWYENATRGVSVYIKWGKIDTVQFFSQAHLNFGGALTPSFLGLDFGMSRDDIRRRFGEPDEVFRKHTTGAIRHGGIDRYFLRDVCIALRYAIWGHLEVIGFERPERSK